MRNLRTEWDEKGYVVLRGLIPRKMIDEYLQELKEASGRPDVEVLCEGLGVIKATERPPEQHHYRYNDLLKLQGPTYRIIEYPPLSKAVSACFGRPCMFAQTLSFDWPSEQKIHQDWPYVTTISDSHYMAGAWVVADPASVENGPLFYYPGSHRVPRFSSGDPKDNQAEFVRYLEEKAKTFTRELFLADPGDVLLWHGDLIHGGSEATNRSMMRRSLIIHYTVSENAPKPSFVNRVLGFVKPGTGNA